MQGLIATLDRWSARAEGQPAVRDGAPLWLNLASAALSLALLGAVATRLSTLDWQTTLALMPGSAAFWGVFAAFYLIGPAADWIIFRHLWPLPPAEGFAALLRKMIYNELVLGYLGETWFYAWARRNGGIAQAPFGAVKDVAILSALVGNFVTLVLIAAFWPLVHDTVVGSGTRGVVLALAPAVLISLGVVLFRRRVLSLSRDELAFAGAMHLARVLGKGALLALLWHLALPGVPLAWWLYLSTLRLLVTRLPMVPNKDVIFAGLAVIMLGRELDIASLMALTAALVLAAHIALAALFLLGDFARKLRPG